jgi:acyl dehydratase
VKIGPLTRSHFARFAVATNDFNPIHLDDTFAQAAGLPTAVGSGLLAASLIAETAGGTEGQRLSVRFRQPIFPGNVLDGQRSADGKGYEVVNEQGAIVAIGRLGPLPQGER